MPITAYETQVQWTAAGGGDSVTVAAGGTATSDALAVDQADVNLAVLIEAVNNAATPAADAKLEVYQLASTGDLNGDAADDYTTVGHASLIAVLDVSSGGEPSGARRDTTLSTAFKSYQFYVKNTGATDGITVRIRVRSQRVS